MSDAPADVKAPLLAHIVELKKRLIIALLGFFAAAIVAYEFAPQIYGFLLAPLAESFPDGEQRRLIYTGLTEVFLTYLKLAIFGGFFLSFPVIASQIYLFLAPGLYKKERRVLLPYLVAAPVLFLLGAALCYYFIFPLAWKFFVGFESAQAGMPIQLEARVSEYLSLVTHLLVAFGLSFQLPILLTLLVRFGMLKTSTLARGRRFAIVIIVTVAAFITPPDIFSQIALSVPLYLLYEISIIACRAIERRAQTPEDSSTI